MGTKQYSFNDDKGNTYEFSGPDDATDEEISHVLANMKPTKLAAKAPDTSVTDDLIEGTKGTGALLGDIASGFAKIPVQVAATAMSKVARPDMNLNELWNAAGQSIEGYAPSFGNQVPNNIVYEKGMKPFEYYGKGIDYAANKLSMGNQDVEGAIRMAGNLAPIPFAGKLARGAKGLAERVDPGLRNIKPVEVNPVDNLPVRTPEVPVEPQAVVPGERAMSNIVDSQLTGWHEPIRNNAPNPEAVMPWMNEQLAKDRYSKAQSEIEARNQQQTFETTKQTNLDLNAAERQRQLEADTGYSKYDAERTAKIKDEVSSLQEQVDTLQQERQALAQRQATKEEQVAAANKQAEAQRMLEERQTQLEYEVTKQHNLDFNAAERARQENAPLLGGRKINVPNSQRGGIDFDAISKGLGGIAEKLRSPIRNIPGHQDTEGNRIATYPNPDEVKARIIAEGKNTKLFNEKLRAGMSHTYTTTKDFMFRTASDFVQTAKKRTDRAVKQFVDPAQHALIELKKENPKQFVHLANLFKKEMFERTTYTPSELLNAGFTPKQVTSYQLVRQMFKAAYDAQTKVLEAKGLKPLSEADFYLSSRRVGDYATYLYDKDGKLVWMLKDKSKWDQNKAIEWIHKNVPEVDPSRTQAEVRKGSDVHEDPASAYASLIQRFGDEPIAQKIKEVMLARDSAQDVKAFQQFQHFKSKANIRGFEGDRPWKDPVQNATDLFDHQFNYAKNAFSWSELNTASEQLKGILRDEQIMKQSPDSVKYVNEYLDRAMGQGPQITRNLESYLMHPIWLSGSSLRRGSQTLKSMWVTKVMALNTGNAVQNAMQPINTLPYHRKLSLDGYPHNATKTLLLSTADTLGGLAEHYGNRLGIKSRQALTDLGREATKYAEDNFILDLSPFDEHLDINSKDIPGLTPVINAGRGMNQITNKAANFSAFMSFVHHLDQSGKFSNRMELFREAEHLMNASMVDFRPSEKPFLIQDTGAVGTLGSGLQSYLINAANTLGAFVHEGRKNNNWSPLAIAIGTNAVTTGLKGAIPIAALIAIQDYLEEHSTGEKTPGIGPDFDPKWNQFIPDIRRMVMDIGNGVGEPGSFARTTAESGVASAMSGKVASLLSGGQNQEPMDLGSRFELTPSMPGVGMIADTANTIGAVGKGLADTIAGDTTGLAKAAYAIAPAGVGQGTIAAYGPFTNKSGMTISPVTGKETGYKRTGTDKLYKALGVASLKETRQRDMDYHNSKKNAMDTKIINNLSESIAAAALNDRKPSAIAIRGLFKQYPDVAAQALETAIDRKIINMNIPAKERAILRMQKLSQIQNYKDSYGIK